MIRVHHLEKSRSQRILWLLEELGLEYEIVTYQRNPKTMLAPPALRKIHPLGKSPVIEHDGRIVAESGAMIEYLLDVFDKAEKFRPAAGTDDFYRYRYFLHYAEGSAMPPLLLKLVFDKVETTPVPFFIRPIIRGLARKVKADFVHPRLVENLDFLNAELKSRPWFAGKRFSAADIQLYYVIYAAENRMGLKGYPALTDYLDRCAKRAAFKCALEKGGPLLIGD